MSSAGTADVQLVHEAGNVVSACPTEKWVVVNRQLHTATGQHDAVFVHTSSDDVQQVSSLGDCRTAEDLLACCIQVNVGGDTTWVEPSSSWVDARSSILSMMDKKGGVFAYLKIGSFVEINNDATWHDACANAVYPAQNGGKAIDLQYTVSPNASCSSMGKCCQPSGISACGVRSSSSGCCPKPFKASCAEVTEELEKICLHPTPGAFSKPKDCRSSDYDPTCDWAGDKEMCMKCPDMYEKYTAPEDVGPKPENPLLSQYKYAKEALRCCQLPLGPLGGGVIAVSGDGGLRQWQVQNEVSHDAHVPDSFWAIKVESSAGTVSKVLQSDYNYDNAGFVPVFAVTDHVVPPASIELLKKLPGVPEIEVTAKYPTAEVDYPNSGLPVDIHMTAFNPCIPLNSKDSGIPIIIFNFDVTNPLAEDVQVTMMNSQQNLVGWDGHSVITNEVEDPKYGGNSNALLQLNDNITAIDMFNPSLVDPNGQDYNPQDGHFANAVITQPKDTVSTLLQYSSVEDMWKEFTSASGLSGKGQPGPSAKGRTWNGALANTRVIPAKGTTTFTFFLAWHFPHRYTNWRQPQYSILNPPLYLGNHYATVHKTINDVLQYTKDNLSRLSSDTMLFRDSMYNSTLPWQLIDSAAGRVSPLRTPTSMWLADGRFYAFEGCKKDSGCCPLNCAHVWNYEQALCQLWPDLEQTMRDVDLNKGHQVTPSGRLLSRVPVPLVLRPMWMYWKDYETVMASQSACVDGEMGSVLKLYREVRFGADKAFFDACWPSAKAIMNRWMTVNDMGDGTVKIAQPSTYDRSLYGVNTFIGSLYLCGLKAAQQMATMQGEVDLAAAYGQRYEMGCKSLDEKCFTNGAWYTQQVAEDQPQVELLTDSTFVDCLLGQWWGYILDLGDILPFDHCQKTVANIFAYNYIESFNPATQDPRKFYDQRDSGLVIATWPNGNKPKNFLRYTAECAWTGLAHYFAGLCIYLEQTDIGLKVLEDSRNSYDGTRRSPWNEIECGDHYSRPMCAFQLFATASGLTWNNVATGGLSVGFNPRIGPQKFVGFFSLPTGWGQYMQNMSVDKMTGNATIHVAYGTLSVTELTLPFLSATVTVSLGTTPLAVAHVQQNEATVTISFSKPAAVAVNQSLVATFSPQQ